MSKYLLLKLLFFFSATFLYAQKSNVQIDEKEIHNLLDYRGTPNSPEDKSFLVFSDKGSWFGYSIPVTLNQNGFSGPFHYVSGEWYMVRRVSC